VGKETLCSPPSKESLTGKVNFDKNYTVWHSLYKPFGIGGRIVVPILLV
jgi:hypothetical protein